MIVISDTTPLITLMKAMRLDILKNLFEEVCIPEAVFHELISNPLYPDEAAQIKKSDFVKVVSVSKTESVRLIQRATGLDLGESEAIVYADDNHADLLLMDEAAGRAVARKMNIPIMGSVGVLLNAFRSGVLRADEVEVAFARVKSANRHISERLIEDALTIVRAEKK